MELSPSCEANRFSDSQEIPHFLWNPKARYRIHKYPLSKPCWMIRNMVLFYGEELLTPRPNPKVKAHPLSAVRDYLFDIFAAALHIEGRSTIRNPRTRHAVVTGTQLARFPNFIMKQISACYF